jgi:hypothetical protein
VLAAILFPTKKGKSVTVCIGQILDIDDQEFQLKYIKKSSIQISLNSGYGYYIIICSAEINISVVF